MMHFKTDALVVRAEPYRDFDKRVIFLTEQFGKVVGIAPSAQRSRKRFGSGLESLTFISVVFQEKPQSSLVRLQEVKILNTHLPLKRNIKKFAYASYFLELISEVMYEREPLSGLFEFLHSFLVALEKTDHEILLSRLFEARLLPKIGWQPSISNCSVCQRPTETLEKNVWFSYQDGIIYCFSCLETHAHANHHQKVSKEAMLYLKKMMVGEKGLKPKREFEEQLKFLPLFIFHQLGKELYSFRFIETVIAE